MDWLVLAQAVSIRSTLVNAVCVKTLSKFHIENASHTVQPIRRVFSHAWGKKSCSN